MEMHCKPGVLCGSKLVLTFGRALVRYGLETTGWLLEAGLPPGCRC